MEIRLVNYKGSFEKMNLREVTAQKIIEKYGLTKEVKIVSNNGEYEPDIDTYIEFKSDWTSCGFNNKKSNTKALIEELQTVYKFVVLVEREASPYKEVLETVKVKNKKWKF